MAFRNFVRSILLALGLVALSGCGINSVPTAEEEAKARWADVQSAYQRRADLIPNLVEVVRGAASSEQDILTQVIEARASASQVQLTSSKGRRTASKSPGTATTRRCRTITPRSAPSPRPSPPT